MRLAAAWLGSEGHMSPIEPTSRWQRARWQLVHVEGRPGEVVIDAMRLGGDHLEAVSQAAPGDPITVGFHAREPTADAELAKLHSTLEDWNDDEGFCDAYLLPGADRACLVLVHDDDVVIVGTDPA